MGIRHPPRNKQDRLGAPSRAADNVVPLQHGGDESFDILSQSLLEAPTFPDDQPSRRGTHNVPSLLKENARLRALAVKLSNLLGDLPAREWEDAGLAR